MKKLLSLIMALLLAFNIHVYAAENDIVDIAAGNGSFTVLVAALTEADLVGALQGDGPFTVFAPTDDAFTALLAELEITAEQLLAHPQLLDVLLYHVVSGAFFSTDLSDGMDVPTLNGEEIEIGVGHTVTINDSTVIIPNIEATNGVIHVIDQVLIPDAFELDYDEDEDDDDDNEDDDDDDSDDDDDDDKEDDNEDEETEDETPEENPAPTMDIVEIAAGNPDFSVLVAALTKADLVGALQSEGPFTVFAPTDAAFTTLLSELNITAEQLLEHPQLSDVLLYHVVSGKFFSTDLSDGMTAPTLKGETINIGVGDTVTINDSTVIIPDIEATNGVIHVIDKVLVPSDFQLDYEEPKETGLERALRNANERAREAIERARERRNSRRNRGWRSRRFSDYSVFENYDYSERIFEAAMEFRKALEEAGY